MRTYCLAVPFLAGFSRADLPVNCKVSDLLGDWDFVLGTRGDRDVVTTGASYTNLGDETGRYSFRFGDDHLKEKNNLVTNLESGEEGTFTFIYNQGFEFHISGQVWWVNFEFHGNSYSCSKTSVGFASDDNRMNWVRIQGTKRAASESTLKAKSSNLYWTRKYMHDPDFIRRVNQKAQGVWTAEHNPDMEKYTLGEVQARGGASTFKTYKPRENIFETIELAKSRHQSIMQKNAFPENLDWRNHKSPNGTTIENFVSSVKDQGGCGSCYSFASMGLLESRVRIATDNAQKPDFAEQEVITCGKDATYNQGCSGGFNLLVAGKQAHDFGVVEEHCAPYNPSDRTCPDVSGCQRWYADSDYRYLGGYYGATTEDGGEAMIKELQHGPMAVAFNVQGDFGSYKSGVWFDTQVQSEFNPFVPVNHAVLMVGYGVCPNDDPLIPCGDAPAGTPYWICKNSWGTSFGDGGYFLIIRGVDEVGIESAPMRVTAIPQF